MILLFIVSLFLFFALSSKIIEDWKSAYLKLYISANNSIKILLQRQITHKNAFIVHSNTFPQNTKKPQYVSSKGHCLQYILDKLKCNIKKTTKQRKAFSRMQWGQKVLVNFYNIKLKNVKKEKKKKKGT